MHHIFATAYTLFLSNTFISSARLKLAKKIKQGLDYSLSARALSSGGGVGCSGGGGGGRVRMFEPGCMIGGGGDRVGAALQWILSLKSFGNSWDNS